MPAKKIKALTKTGMFRREVAGGRKMVGDVDKGMNWVAVWDVTATFSDEAAAKAYRRSLENRIEKA